jgi:uncharacterized membrane protein YesL
MISRIYRVLELCTDLVYLDLLWLVASVPVVTIALSTVVKFGVVCGWTRGKDFPTTVEYFSPFREKFGRSLAILAISLVRAVLGTVLAVDFLLLGQMESFRHPLYVVFFAFALLYISATVHCTPSWSTTSWTGRE